MSLPQASPTTESRRGRIGIEERKPSLLWGLPLAFMAATLLLGPLVVLAVRSVSSETGFTLSRYIEALTNPQYIESFLVTTLLAVASTVLALILCIPAAIYIERKKSRATQTVAIALTIPLSLPGIVIGFFVILLFGTQGLVPVTTEGILGTGYGRVAYTLVGLLLGYLYFNIPRVILTIRGAVAELSTEVLDAARTLGASPWHVYRRVVIPTLRPAIANASALALATAYGAFGTAATLSRGFRVVPLDIAAAFTERFNPELAATLSVILAIITTTILVVVNKFGVRKGA